MPEKPMERFRRNWDAESNLWKEATDFRDKLQKPGWNRRQGELRELCGRYRGIFTVEKERVEAELKKIGNARSHPLFLERECLNEHLGYVERLIKLADSTRGTEAEVAELGKLVSVPSIYRALSPIRNGAAWLLDFPKEPALGGNAFVEDYVPQAEGLLVINDLTTDDEGMKELVASSARQGNRVTVKPFGALAQKLINRVAEIKPDLIILPLRGGRNFFGLLPRDVRGKTFLYKISEHFDADDRLTGISELVERFKKERPKTVVWLDDEVFTGVQSRGTHKILRDISPDVNFHILALSSYAPGITDQATAPHFFASEDRSLLPMLASKWLPLLAKQARGRGDTKKAARIEAQLEKWRKEKGESGAL